jgi:hypothetical protein
MNSIERRLSELEALVGRACPPCPAPLDPHWTAWCSPDELREVLAADRARAHEIKAAALARMVSAAPPWSPPR